MIVSPRILAALVMVLWASCYPLITLGLDYAPHLTFAALRAILAGSILIGVAALRRAAWPRGWSVWGWITLAGLGMTGIGYFGMFHAAEFVSPGLATVIESLQPLIAAVLAVVFLRERLGPIGWFGLCLGVSGVALIAIPRVLASGGGSTAFGLVLVIMATSGVAVGNIAIKSLATRVDAAMAMGLQLLIGAIPISILAFTTESPTAIDWSPQFIISLLSLALPGTALAYWLWQGTLQSLDVSKAAAFSFLVPIIGVSVGALFFSEPLTINVMGGGALAAIGVYLASRPRSKTSPLVPAEKEA
ncbi:MAG TPA: EamA/RhaT family transporter [Hyphomonas sp.]|nr:EamA/RhaT family transporter [Hyphomonas sp.]HBJ39398.1 EamA/RhaT family transporter [Hyphomonas sp.]